MHEVGKHAECGDQSDDFQESPKGEYDSEQHLEDFVGSVIEIVMVVVVVVKLFGCR